MQLGCDEDMMQKALRIMDDYYKFERSDFEEKMKEILGSEIANKIFAVIDSRSIETLS
jgi:hypothetical protein